MAGNLRQFQEVCGEFLKFVISDLTKMAFERIRVFFKDDT